MAVYFFDINQNLMKIVNDDTSISVIQTQELPDDGSLLKDTLNVEITNDETLLSAEYMAVKGVGNANDFDMYRILDYETAGNVTRFTGVQLAYYELEGYIVEDIRPANQTISYVLNQILTGTDWRLGYVDSGISNITDTFYYLSVKESLKQVQTITNTEMIFKVEISGSKITDKWVEVYHQLGDRTLKRFNYGSNALTITREISKTELFTALIGRGKGEQVSEDGYGRKIDFVDVEWKKTSGKPVDKPIGQKYVELPQATAEYGIATISGVKKPRIGIVEFDDETDPEKLLQSTYDQLLNYARPKVLFKSTVANIGATNIGDTVTIHRHDLDIHYETRVFKVVRDKLNDDKTQIELGDVTYQPITRQKQTIDGALNKVEREVIRQVNYVQASADGKNAVNYGSIEPAVKRVGDLWYRPHPSIAGETQMLTWNGTVWEELKYRVDQLTGEIDANELRIINIDAFSITSNESAFVKTAWNGINSEVTIDGTNGIETQNVNGDFSRIVSGELRSFNADSSSTAILGNGRSQYFDSNGSQFILGNTLHGTDWLNDGTLQVTHNREFAIGRYADYAGNNGNFHPYIALEYAVDKPGDEVNGIVRLYKAVYLQKGIYAGNNDISALSKISFYNGGLIESQSSTSNLLITASNKLIAYAAGTNAFEIDSGYMYLRRNLSMEGNNITNQSDRRLKTNIVDTPVDSLSAISSWNFKAFDRLNNGNHDDIGLIAQDTSEIVVYDEENDIYNVNSSKQIMMNSHAIKQLNEKIDALNKRLDDAGL